MSRADRRQLARFLAELDEPDLGQPAPVKLHPNGEDLAGPYQHDPGLHRQQRLVLLISAGCCVVLAGWIVVLAATLLHHFNAHHWRSLWVNFDVLLLAAFAATAWATWRKRQILILLLMLTGTMLCCDAWFDVGTSLATSGMWLSIASAIFAELPLALLAFAVARSLLKATVEAGLPVPAAAGDQPPGGDQSPGGWRGAEGAHRWSGPSLRRTPLAGAGLEEALPGGRAQDRAERALR